MKFLALCAGALLMASAVRAAPSDSSDSVDANQPLSATMMSETLEEDVSCAKILCVQQRSTP